MSNLVSGILPRHDALRVHTLPLPERQDHFGAGHLKAVLAKVERMEIPRVLQAP